MYGAVLHTIRDYIRIRQSNIAEKLAYRPIYELCAKADQMPGTSRMMSWWDQDVVNKPEEYTEILCNLT